MSTGAPPSGGPGPAAPGPAAPPPAAAPGAPPSGAPLPAAAPAPKTPAKDALVTLYIKVVNSIIAKMKAQPEQFIKDTTKLISPNNDNDNITKLVRKINRRRGADIKGKDYIVLFTDFPKTDNILKSDGSLNADYTPTSTIICVDKDGTTGTTFKKINCTEITAREFSNISKLFLNDDFNFKVDNTFYTRSKVLELARYLVNKAFDIVVDASREGPDTSRDSGISPYDVKNFDDANVYEDPAGEAAKIAAISAAQAEVARATAELEKISNDLGTAKKAQTAAVEAAKKPGFGQKAKLDSAVTSANAEVARLVGLEKDANAAFNAANAALVKAQALGGGGKRKNKVKSKKNNK